jgi:hypothetical protein
MRGAETGLLNRWRYIYPYAQDARVTIQYSTAGTFILLLGYLLNACSSLNYKEPPASASTALVRFATDAGVPSVVRVYDDSTCRTNEQEWLRV